MAIKLPNGKIARTIAEQVYKNMQDILFLMNKKDFQILVVDELPEEGSENTLYLVPSDDPEQDNVYTEYIWTGTAFEMVGTTAIDISNMVTTDTNQNIIGEKVFEAPVTFYDNITLTVDAAFEGDMLPKSTDSYDLGSATYTWKDFYLSGSIIGSGSSNLDIKNGSTTLRVQPNGFVASDYFIPLTAGGGDLGVNGVEWRDLYLSGSIKQTNYTITWNNGIEFKNASNQTLLYVAYDKSVWFYGKLTPSGNPDIGDASHRVKNLYLSGNLTDGTNSVNVADLKALIDYAKAQGWIS